MYETTKQISPKDMVLQGHTAGVTELTEAPEM